MKDLKNKVVIITGSSRGIGLALAKALAKEGALIVLNGRNKERLNAAKAEVDQYGSKTIAVSCDIGKKEGSELLVNQTVETFGRIDVLMNNAGLAMEGKIEDTDLRVFEQVIHTNLLGVLYPTQAALPYIKKTKGSIIFTGSIAGFMGLPEYSAYSASKMALTAITQSLRIELANTGVHIGIVYVGFAENDAEKTFLNSKGETEKMPIREGFKRMPLETVAQHFIGVIKNRKRQKILSGIGLGTSFMHRFFPALFEKLMTRRYMKTKLS
jgi:short-subunit dehydrogenase